MDRKKHRIFWGCLAAAVLIAIAVFFTCFQITSVKVEGNQNYTEDEIKKMVLSGPLSGNSVLVRFLNPDERTKDEEFINKVWLERTGRHSLVIHVREKELIGYVKFLDGNLYFDRNGIVQVSTTEELENIPNVEGLTLDKVGVGEKIPGLEKGSLSLILSVTKMMEKGDRKPDRLVLDEKGQLVLYYGKVEARMGSDKNMDEKMSRLMGIIPQLEGMEGVLHLENVDETSKNVVFDKVLRRSNRRGRKRSTKAAMAQMNRIPVMRILTVPMMSPAMRIRMRAVMRSMTPDMRTQETGIRIITRKIPATGTVPGMKTMVQMMVPGKNDRGILFFMGHKSGNFDNFFKFFVKK